MFRLNDNDGLAVCMVRCVRHGQKLPPPPLVPGSRAETKKLRFGFFHSQRVKSMGKRVGVMRVIFFSLNDDDAPSSAAGFHVRAGR